MFSVTRRGLCENPLKDNLRIVISTSCQCFATVSMFSPDDYVTEMMFLAVL